MRYGLLTGARLRRTDQTLCIRDMAFGPLVLHPQSWSDEMEEVCASPVWQGRFRQATGMPRAPSLTAMWVWLETSANEMGEAGVPEPYWVKDLPHGLKCWLRMGRRLVHTPREVLTANLGIPSTSLLFSVYEDGLLYEAEKAYDIRRLQGIHQLGFLRDPVSNDSRRQNTTQYPHSRFEHVLSVAAVTTLIGRNLRLGANDFDLVRLAAFTHDTLTPAGGDTTKLIDPARFDEDAHYPELFQRPEVAALLRRRKLPQTKLAATIRGEGMLSQVLDYADKIAYTMCDAHHFVSRVLDSDDPNVGRVAGLLAAFPYLGDVWDTIRFVDGKLVFSDADQLERFLRLRTLMFRSLYFAPRARFMEFLLGRVILAYLYQHNIVSAPWLLAHTDHDLIDHLNRFMDVNWHAPLDTFWEMDFTLEQFVDEVSARRCAEMLQKKRRLTFVDCFRGKIKPGLQMLVADEGRVMPFAAARPRQAQEIQTIADEFLFESGEMRPWLLFSAKPPRFNKRTKAAIKWWQNQNPEVPR